MTDSEATPGASGLELVPGSQVEPENKATLTLEIGTACPCGWAG
jgi:hypothetical protein